MTRGDTGRLLVLAALAYETRGLVRRLTRQRVAPGEAGLEVHTIGLRGSELSRLAGGLLDLRATAVMVAGLAGGCAPGVRTGDLVLGDPVGPTRSGRWVHPDAELAARARQASATAGVPLLTGTVVTTSGEIVESPHAKAELWRARGAVAVDMESAHVLEWAVQVGLRAVVVRAIADGPDEAVPPELAVAMTSAGRLRPAAAIAWAGRPGLIRAAWRLRRRSERALDNLARLVVAFWS